MKQYMFPVALVLLSAAIAAGFVMYALHQRDAQAQQVCELDCAMLKGEYKGRVSTARCYCEVDGSVHNIWKDRE